MLSLLGQLADMHVHRARALVDAGFTSLEAIAWSTPQELAAVLLDRAPFVTRDEVLKKCDKLNQPSFTLHLLSVV